MDIYDENKNKTGKTINRKDKDKLNENEFILSVYSWIINSKKEILITQRSTYLNRGGKWEDTHGGVRAGETSTQGMKRELKEELGIDIKDNEVMNCKYVSIEEFKEIIKMGESTFTDFLQTLFDDIDINKF